MGKYLSPDHTCEPIFFLFFEFQKEPKKQNKNRSQPAKNAYLVIKKLVTIEAEQFSSSASRWVQNYLGKPAKGLSPQFVSAEKIATVCAHVTHTSHTRHSISEGCDSPVSVR
jgi:hypothetical protein